MVLLPENPGRELALAGLTGALSLVSPADLSPRALTAYRVTCGVLSGAFAYTTMRIDDELADRPAARLAVAVGGGAAVFASMGLWERWDAKVHGWLVARGVRHPRVLIAAGAAATSLLGAVLDAGVSRVDLPAPSTGTSGPSPT